MQHSAVVHPEYLVLIDSKTLTIIARSKPSSWDSGLATKDGGPEIGMLRMIWAFLRVLFGSRAAPITPRNHRWTQGQARGPCFSMRMRFSVGTAKTCSIAWREMTTFLM